MSSGQPGRPAVEARILYWGIPGSGKSTNLQTIRAKLRADHRGELRNIPTRVDPTVTFEVLPIQLGEVKGVPTCVQIIAAPSAPEQSPTRKQLLDRVNGIVFVVDAQRDRIDENIACLQELRQSLAAYGRSLSDLPVVVQYNKHDLADLSALEELQRKLDIPGAAVFETVATEGQGALRTLTTISKRVVRILRDQRPVPSHADAQVTQPIPATARTQPAGPGPAPSAAQVMESAILTEDAESEDALAADSAVLEAQVLLDETFEEAAGSPARAEAALPSVGDLQILSVGAAKQVGQRSVQIPIVLGRPQGDHIALSLTIQLDPLLDGEHE
jgi:signal recognition particle receptor subunit beta